jgi:hypothetical protein
VATAPYASGLDARTAARSRHSVQAGSSQWIVRARLDVSGEALNVSTQPPAGIAAAVLRPAVRQSRQDRSHDSGRNEQCPPVNSAGKQSRSETGTSTRQQTGEGHLQRSTEPAQSQQDGRSGSVRFGWALVKLLAARLLPVGRSAPWAATTTALLRVAALTLALIRIASTGLSRLSGLGRAFTISRGEHDLEFDQFIPLCIRALPLGDSQQGLHSLARRYWLLFAHGCIVSSIGNFGIRMLTRPGTPSARNRRISFELARCASTKAPPKREMARYAFGHGTGRP